MKTVETKIEHKAGEEQKMIQKYSTKEELFCGVNK